MLQATTPDPRLAELLEIALPTPVSYEPQTAGWYGLFAAVLMGLVALGVRWRRRYKANLYRRLALADLNQLEQKSREPGTRLVALKELPELVKRTTLSFAPRDDVAALHGQDWLRFLDSTLPGDAFSAGPGHLLPTLAYAPQVTLEEISVDQTAEIFASVRHWIQKHDAGV